MKKTNSHKWVFVSRFRTNAYGWRASKLACKRIKEAVSEIKKVTRKDPVLGAEGSIKFMEKLWHQKALEKAKDASLSGFIDICVKTKEWDILANHISSIDTKQLEGVSHNTTEKAAKGLTKLHELAAAKIYSALGIHILKKGKSKYYRYTLEHFRMLQKLYEKAGLDQLWIDLIERVRRDHSRNYSFISDFEKIVAGCPQKKPESFKTRTLKRWKKQIS